MCYFITISAEEDLKQITKEILPSGLILRENNNTFFVKRLGEKFKSFNVVDGLCSCSLYPLLLPESKNDEIEQVIKKYKRKGWSKNKIQRALEEMKKKLPREPVPLREFIAETVKNVDDLWLYAHQYSGLIESEKLESGESRELKVSDFLDKNTEILENELVKIVI